MVAIPNTVQEVNEAAAAEVMPNRYGNVRFFGCSDHMLLSKGERCILCVGGTERAQCVHVSVKVW